MLKVLNKALVADLMNPLVFADGVDEILNRSFVFTGLSADFNTLTNATGTDNFADFRGGTNAMKLVGDAAGGNEAVNAVSPNTIVYAPVSVLHVKLKDVLKTAAKRWCRITVGNVDDNGGISFNVTDVEVGNTGSMFSSATIVALANDWVLLEMTLTLGGPDFTGNLTIGMADADNDASIDNSAPGNELGIHELTIHTVT